MNDSTTIIETGLPSTIIVKLIDYGQKLMICGKTFKYKDLMKSVRGKWDTENQGWIMDITKKDEIIELMHNRLKSELVKKFESKLKRGTKK